MTDSPDPCPIGDSLPECAGEHEAGLCREELDRVIIDKSRYYSSILHNWPASPAGPRERPGDPNRWFDHMDREPFPAGDGGITVIIPTRDRPVLAGRALKSLATQERGDWRCVVVLNGPAATDPAYLDGLRPFAKDPRISFLAKPAAAGIAEPINAGLVLATTEFCAVLDDDDEWKPSFLGSLAAPLLADRTLGLAYCDAEHPTSPVGPGAPAGTRPRRPDPPVDGPFFATMAMRNWFGWSQALWRRELLAPAGLEPEALGCADWDAWLRIGALAGAYHVPETLASHHWQGDNFSLDLGAMQPGFDWVRRRLAAGLYLPPAGVPPRKEVPRRPRRCRLLPPDTGTTPATKPGLPRSAKPRLNLAETVAFYRRRKSGLTAEAPEIP